MAASLTDIDFNLILWTLVLFVLFAGVLWKFAWGPILATIDEREKSVRDEVEGAARANAEAAQLLEKHKELVRDAGRERDEILKRTRAEADQIQGRAAGQGPGGGRPSWSAPASRSAASATPPSPSLRAQVADVAIEAAASIVESSLTKDAQRKIVDEFVSSLEAQRRAGRA